MKAPKLKTLFCCSTIALVLLALILSALLSLSYLQTATQAQEQQRLKESAQYLKTTTQDFGLLRDYATAHNLRITLIKSEGTVAFDSMHDPFTMDNHLGRPEIQQAIKEGIGLSIRPSDTVGISLLYVALVQDEGSIIRVSKPFSFITAWKKEYAKALLFIVLTLGSLSAIVSLVVANRSNKALSALTYAAQQYQAGNLLHQVQVQAPQEYALLATTLSSMADQLNTTFQTLSRTGREYQALLNAMHEAVVLIDEQKIIRISNTAFDGLFNHHACPVGLSFPSLVQDPSLEKAIEQALSTEVVKPMSRELSANKMYQIQFSPLLEHGRSVHALALSFFEITDLLAGEFKSKEIISSFGAMLAEMQSSPTKNHIADILLFFELNEYQKPLEFTVCDGRELLNTALNELENSQNAFSIEVEQLLLCKVDLALAIKAITALLELSLKQEGKVTIRAYQAGKRVCYAFPYLQDQDLPPTTRNRLLFQLAKRIATLLQGELFSNGSNTILSLGQ